MKKLKVKSESVENRIEINKDKLCEYCNGTGEISQDESDGEGHFESGVGTRKCLCQVNN